MTAILGIIATVATIPVIIFDGDITATVFMGILTAIAIREELRNDKN